MSKGFIELIRIFLLIGLTSFSGCGFFSQREAEIYINDYYHPYDILGIYEFCSDLKDCRIRIAFRFKNREGLSKLGLSELHAWNSASTEKFYWLDEPSEIKSVSESWIRLNAVQRSLKKLEIPLLKNGAILDFSELFNEKQEIKISSETRVNSELISVHAAKKRNVLRFRYSNDIDVYYKNIHKSETNRFYEYKSQGGKADLGEGSEAVKIEKFDFSKSLLLNLNGSIFLLSTENADFQSAGTVNIPPLKSVKLRTPSGFGGDDRSREDPLHSGFSFLYALELLFRISQALK